MSRRLAPPEPRNEHSADDDSHHDKHDDDQRSVRARRGGGRARLRRPRGVEERDEVRHPADGFGPELLADPGRKHVLAGRSVLGRADRDPVGAVRGGGRPDAAPGDEAEAAVDLALAAFGLVRQGAFGSRRGSRAQPPRRRWAPAGPGPARRTRWEMPPAASGAVTSTTSASPARRSMRYQSTSPGASRVAPIARESVGSSSTKAVAGDSLPGSTTIGACAATGAAATVSNSEAAAMATRRFTRAFRCSAPDGCRQADASGRVRTPARASR